MKEDGTVWAVGLNSHGQLGDGSFIDRSNPVQLLDGSGIPLSGVVSISAGGDFTVCLKEDRTVWAVGNNFYGQLGDGTTIGRSSLVQVVDSSGNPLRDIVSISAGDAHTIFLRGDGTVLAVGRNNRRLGDGTTTDRSNPVQVVHGSGYPISEVVGISAGEEHSTFLKMDGTIWAVGTNLNGQLGDGSYNHWSYPVQVVDGSGNPFTGVIAISAGESHTVFLKNDGTVWAAGYNANGRLGDGTVTQRNQPVCVVDDLGNPFSDVVAISAGASHTSYQKRTELFGRWVVILRVNLETGPPLVASTPC